MLRGFWSIRLALAAAALLAGGCSLAEEDVAGPTLDERVSAAIDGLRRVQVVDADDVADFGNDGCPIWAGPNPADDTQAGHDLREHALSCGFGDAEWLERLTTVFIATGDDVEAASSRFWASHGDDQWSVTDVTVEIEGAEPMRQRCWLSIEEREAAQCAAEFRHGDLVIMATRLEIGQDNTRHVDIARPLADDLPAILDQIAALEG